MSANKVILLGRLGKDPETREVNGTNVCKFSLATSETWKDKSGQKQEKTEWHNVVIWGNQAEACGKYLKKGSQAFVEGKIEYRSYQKDDETKYITEVKAVNIRFVGGEQKAETDTAGF